jgi:phytoene dehydrogenase-like protein
MLVLFGNVDAQAVMRMPALEWVERALSTEGARGVLKNFLRVATYTGDLARLSAGAAIVQLQHVVKHNVLYLDGGWQVLVEALRERAMAAGATIWTGNGVDRVEARGHGDVRVTLHDGPAIDARAAVLAVGPRAAAAIVPGSGALAQIAERSVKVSVSTLDLALSRLPKPRVLVAFGTERPLYYSVHSAVARLGPENGAVVHVMKYGAEGDARATEQELEELMDRLQPGWRELVVHRRFLPAMVVANDLVAAERGGLAGRPDVSVPDAEGVLIAGDWVGSEGMLLDAALASAKRAARECAAALATREQTSAPRRNGAPAGAAVA